MINDLNATTYLIFHKKITMIILNVKSNWEYFVYVHNLNKINTRKIRCKYLVLSELGRMSLLLDCFINVIKYWKRLESNPSPHIK